MTCSLCNKEIKTGEARYTALEINDPPEYRHFFCHKEKIAACLAELGTLNPTLRRRLENALANRSPIKLDFDAPAYQVPVDKHPPKKVD